MHPNSTNKTQAEKPLTPAEESALADQQIAEHENRQALIEELGLTESQAQEWGI